ncbi:MAG TPA: hypothetical protein VKY29_06745 [Cryomorphaceae bacterium]|nr:hypothetical protein [Cryomorphaceae bacterium]
MSDLQSRYAAKLAPHLPPGTAREIARWIVELRVTFVIAKPRKTKYGDFRINLDGKNPRISINGDLNPYAFLVTTIHEFAHYGCFLKHGHKAAPHGKEWKAIFSDLLRIFNERKVFPQDLAHAIAKHLRQPTASSCSCPVLSRALAKYDERPATFLGDLRPGDTFHFNGEVFEYIEKRRTRCLCRNVKLGKDYLISIHAPVAETEKRELV